MPWLAFSINARHIEAMTNLPELIYHMAHEADWNAAMESGAYSGSPDDLRDGFIHFSTAEQIRGSAAKHRAGQTDLLLVAYKTNAFGAELKWEGKTTLFPHIYGQLDPATAAFVRVLPLGSDGLHVFPEEIA